MATPPKKAATARKPAAKKAPAKKAAAKKPVAKRAPTKRPSTAKKAPAQKTPVKRTPPKETPPPDDEYQRESVETASRSGNRLRTLQAVRDRLAEMMESRQISGAELASLSRQMNQVTAEIDRLAPPQVKDPVDELAERRAARAAGTAPANRMPGRSKRS